MKKVLPILLACLFVGSLSSLAQTNFNAIQIQHKQDPERIKVLKISDLVKTDEARNGLFSVFSDRGKGTLTQVTENSFTLQNKKGDQEYNLDNIAQLYKWQKGLETGAHIYMLAATTVFVIAVSGTEDDSIFGNIEGAAYTAVYMLALIPPLVIPNLQGKNRFNKWEYSPVYKE